MSKHILLVDDTSALRTEIRNLLEINGYRVTEAADGQTALNLLYADVYDLVLLDLYMPGLDGRTVLASIRKQLPRLPIVMMSGTTDLADVSDLYWNGATYFVAKPFDAANLVQKLNMVLQREKPTSSKATKGQSESTVLEMMIGDSESMKKLKSKIRRLAKYEDDVRLTGEEGSGKELVAKALHEMSLRAGKPFIAINCAAITETLADDFFFGHVKGAFYGADSDKKGVLQEAEGGSIFMDEVADLPMTIQNKLLRVLSDRTIMRLGCTKTIRINVRVITATNKPLHKMIDDASFRSDIFHRIDSLTIAVPSLAERREDIPRLVQFFTDEFCKRNLFEGSFEYSPAALDLICKLDYRGNIRQLRNLVHKLCAECDDKIEIDHIIRICREDPFLGDFPFDGCAA